MNINIISMYISGCHVRTAHVRLTLNTKDNTISTCYRTAIVIKANGITVTMESIVVREHTAICLTLFYISYHYLARSL